jgi:hypothetical protein
MCFPLLPIRFDYCLECAAFSWCQVAHLIFVVDGEEPELKALDPPVIDHPQSAAFALSAPGVAEPQFAKASCFGDQVSRVGMNHQQVLKCQVGVVVEICGAVARKGRQLDKDAFHECEYTQVAYSRWEPAGFFH